MLPIEYERGAMQREKRRVMSRKWRKQDLISVAKGVI